MSINPHFKGHEAVNEKFLWDEIMLMDQNPHHNVRIAEPILQCEENMQSQQLCMSPK